MRPRRPARCVPFASVTNAAAAMPEPAPHSAWQPPVSAAKVAWAAMKTPIMPAASIPRVISSSDRPMSLAAPMQAPGSPPHAPAVGAATMTPIELFDLHHGRDVEDDPVQHPAIEQPAFSHAGAVAAGLVAEDAIGVVRACDALEDGRMHDLDDLLHPLENLRLGQIASGALVPQGQFPKGQILVRVVLEHLLTGDERDAHVAAGQHRQHGGDVLQALDAELRAEHGGDVRRPGTAAP